MPRALTFTRPSTYMMSCPLPVNEDAACEAVRRLAGEPWLPTDGVWEVRTEAPLHPKSFPAATATAVEGPGQDVEASPLGADLLGRADERGTV